MNSYQTFKQIEGFARSRGLPLIPINAGDISIIEDPKSFFLSILNQIKTSQKRICLSSLYLGVSSKERALVDRIHNQLEAEKSLKVDIALDANRALRTDKHNQSSVGILKKLNGFGRRVTINLVETRRNSFFNWLMNRFQRWNEIISTYHAKFLVFDDNVILTGANLSCVYFDLRRDRYLLLRKSPMLANYLSDLILSFSTELGSLRDKIGSVNKNYVEQVMQQDYSDTYAMPLVQFGPLKITDKEDFIVFLNSIRSDESELFLASGYFNPSPKMSSISISSALIASEAANNFSTGPGLMKHVPKLYTALYKEFFDHHPGTALNLYEKKDWSFHAKGLWFENPGDIYIHIVGSSNYNYRSSVRDLENQIVIITKNETLIKKLKEERQSLWLDTRPARKDYFMDLNPLHKAFARLFRSFL